MGDDSIDTGYLVTLLAAAHLVGADGDSEGDDAGALRLDAEL